MKRNILHENKNRELARLMIRKQQGKLKKGDKEKLAQAITGFNARATGNRKRMQKVPIDWDSGKDSRAETAIKGATQGVKKTKKGEVKAAAKAHGEKVDEGKKRLQRQGDALIKKAGGIQNAINADYDANPKLGVHLSKERRNEKDGDERNTGKKIRKAHGTRWQKRGKHKEYVGKGGTKEFEERMKRKRSMHESVMRHGKLSELKEKESLGKSVTTGGKKVAHAAGEGVSDLGKPVGGVVKQAGETGGTVAKSAGKLAGGALKGAGTGITTATKPLAAIPYVGPVLAGVGAIAGGTVKAAGTATKAAGKVAKPVLNVGGKVAAKGVQAGTKAVGGGLKKLGGKEGAANESLAEYTSVKRSQLREAEDKPKNEADVQTPPPPGAAAAQKEPGSVEKAKNWAAEKKAGRAAKKAAKDAAKAEQAAIDAPEIEKGRAMGVRIKARTAAMDPLLSKRKAAQVAGKGVVGGVKMAHDSAQALGGAALGAAGSVAKGTAMAGGYVAGRTVGAAGKVAGGALRGTGSAIGKTVGGTAKGVGRAVGGTTRGASRIGRDIFAIGNKTGGNA